MRATLDLSRWRGAAPLALGGYGLAVCAYLVLPALGADLSRIDGALRAAAPLGALAACVGALLALPPGAVLPWTLLCVSALLAAAAALSQATAAVGIPWSILLGTMSTCLFAAGAAWLIHQRERERGVEIALDAALLVTAAAVMLLRWSPGVHALLDDGGDAFRVMHVVVRPLAAVCGMLFTAALWASRRESGAGGFAALLAGTAVLLTVSAFPPALTPNAANREIFNAAAVAGWGCLAFAGLRVARGGARAFLSADSDAGSGLLRQAAAPVVALMIAIAVTDAALRPPMRQATAYALALLGLLLAVRLNVLLKATRHRSTERRQLAQSQALVEVSRALAGSTDLDGTLQQVSHWACRLLNAEAAVLELLTDDGERMEVRAAAGFATRMIGMKFPVDGTFTGWSVRHGAPRATADPRFEPDIRPEARRLLGNRPTSVAPLRYHDRPLGALACIGTQPFDSADLELLGALADQAAIAIENARLFEEVNGLSMTDPLTGLSNRRRLEQELAREFEAARRGRGLVAVMFDLNEFKEYNDRYGHLAGDDALRAFGEVLKDETRTMNVAARYGGDEFFVLLADADLAGARVMVERVRHRTLSATSRGGREPLTVSAGIADYHPDMRDPAELVAAADAALYRSKAERPRVG
jgi:diguanylate cyclase (GGDEF)-like protein